MNNVRIASLGDVGVFIRGITFKPTDVVPTGTESSAVCMRTKNVQRDLDQADLISVPSSFVKRREQYLQEGDILISSANSWNLVGKCCWVPRLPYLATAGGFICVFRANEELICKRYLFHWLSSAPTQSRLRQCGRQTTNISNLSIPLAEKLKLPLPPLPEQKRIAAILDKADEIRRKREKAIELTDSFLRSVIWELMNELSRLSSNHKRVPLEELADISSGFAFKSSWFRSKGLRLIRIGDIQDGLIRRDSCVFVEDTLVPNNGATVARTGDILMALSGATTGKIGVVDQESNGSLVNQRIAIIRPSSPELGLILSNYLPLPQVQRELLKSAAGSAQPNLSPNDLRVLGIPSVNSTDMQHTASLLRAAQLSASKQRHAAELCIALCESLAHCCFKSQVQAPVMGTDITEMAHAL